MQRLRNFVIDLLIIAGFGMVLWTWIIPKSQKSYVAEWVTKTLKANTEYVPPALLKLLDSETDSSGMCKDTTLVTFCMLEKYHVKFPNIVMAQHIAECGWDRRKSDIFLNGHNAFGMKPNKRGIMSGEYKGHAAYLNVEQSIKDYAAWQKERLASYEAHNGAVLNETQYFHFLECLFIRTDGTCASYAEYADTNANGEYDYVEHLKKILVIIYKQKKSHY